MRVFPLSSSTLRYIGYDAETKTLLASFKNASWYSYADVPKTVFADLIVASSHGQVFDRLVKKGGYKFGRVDVSVVTEAGPDGFGAHNATIIKKADKAEAEEGA